MTGDSLSGLENDGDSYGAHLRVREPRLQTQHRADAARQPRGLVPFPRPHRSDCGSRTRADATGSGLAAFAPRPSLRLGGTQGHPSQPAERKPFVRFPTCLAQTPFSSPEAPAQQQEEGTPQPGWPEYTCLVICGGAQTCCHLQEHSAWGGTSDLGARTI